MINTDYKLEVQDHSMELPTNSKVADKKGDLLNIILKMQAKKLYNHGENGIQNKVYDEDDIDCFENDTFKKGNKSKVKMGIHKNTDDSLDKKHKNIREEFNETPLTVSTITATGSIGCNINIASLYFNIVIDDVCDVSIKRDGFTYIEWGQKEKETLCKGLHKKMTIKHKRVKEGKRFDKQLTVILRKYDSSLNTYFYQNLKIFYNGVIQMTGLKSTEQGKWVLEYVLNLIKEIKANKDPNIYNDDHLSMYGSKALTVHNYSIRLINTNFCLGYAVNRRALCDFLHHNNIYHVFEASRYPGVKIPFYWKADKLIQDGACRCEGNICTKKTKTRERRENSGSHCQKITIIVFQSGSIIITGGQTMCQICDSFEFIKDIFAKIKDIVKKPFMRIKTNKTYPKFSYNDINEKKKASIKLPYGYTYDFSIQEEKKESKNESREEKSHNL